MELIERYVKDVGRRLPKANREDIEAELRSTLEDDLEGRSLGQPTEDDVVAMLNDFGSPESVAASYSGDQFLIGPQLYPQFITTLRLVLAVLAGLVTLGFAASLLSQDASGAFSIRLAAFVSDLLDSVITSLGIVVIVFALLERLDLKVRLPEIKKAWDPKDLPAVRDADVVGRFDSIAEIVFPAIFLILMNQFRDRIGFTVSQSDGGWSAGIISDADSKLLLNDVFLDNLPWINASLLLPMALSVWLFWSGRWNLPTRLLKIAFDVFGLFVFYRLCQGLLGAEADLVAAGLPAFIVGFFSQAALYGPIGVAIIVVFDAAKHLYRIFQRRT